MTCIAYDGRVAGEFLPASHQACQFAYMGESVSDVGIGYVVALLLEQRQGCKQGVGILFLTDYAQLAFQVVEACGLVDVVS